MLDYESIVEIHEEMRRAELEGPDLRGVALIKGYRGIVDWLLELRQDYGLQKTTLHVTLGIFNQVLARVNLDPRNLDLCALTCFFIAAKLEENAMMIPSLVSLHRELEKRGNSRSTDVLAMEKSILALLAWRLKSICPLDFLGYYVTPAVSAGDKVKGRSIRDYGRVLRYLTKFVDYFIILVLQDPRFLVFPPSLLAAACVLCARRALDITTDGAIWPVSLQLCTRYKSDAIEPVAAPLWKVYQHWVASHPVREDGDRPAGQSPRCVAQDS